MKSTRHVLLPLVLTLLLMWAIEASSEAAPLAVSQETTEGETARDTLFAQSPTDSVFVDSLRYTCDSLFTDVQNEIIVLSGAANIRYESSTINADTVKIDMKRDHASSSGRVELKDGSYLMLGDALSYDIDRKEALVTQGATRFESGFFYGAEVRKVGDETYDIDDGYFTTCDAAHPDYYIWSKKMRMYRNDMLIARPTVFFVNHFPVLALPFGAISIKRGRKTGILIPEPGYNSNDGKYVENIAYFYAWKDYADATLAFDWMEKTGWEGRLEGRYVKRYVLNGDFLAQLQERTLGISGKQREWRLKSRHHQEIGYATKLDANLDFVSSRSIWEGSADTDERLSESVTSSFSYQTPLFSRDVWVTASYNENLSTDVKTLTLPSVSYTMPGRPIYELFVKGDDDVSDDDAWWKNFSYTARFKAVHYGRVTDPDANWRDIFYRSKRDSTDVFINEHHAGALQTLGLTWSTKLRGWLNVSQRLSSVYVIHDRDRQNDKLPMGYEWNTATTLKFSLYGVRDFGGGPFTAVRHVMTPSLSFSYQPDLSYNSNLYRISSVSVRDADRARNLSFALDNAWDLKLHGDEGERKIDNFFKVNSRIGYDLEKDDKPFTNITHNVDLNPGNVDTRLVSFKLVEGLDITQDAYDFDVNLWTLSTSLNFSGDADYIEYFPREPNRFETSRFLQPDSLEAEEEEEPLTIDRLEQQTDTDGWSLKFTHYYSRRKGRDKPTSHNLRSYLKLSLTRNWYIEYDHHYDFLDDRVVSQNISITRMLHCWKLSFTWGKSGDYWDYKLRLFAIKLPDALQFRTSDHKH